MIRLYIILVFIAFSCVCVPGQARSVREEIAALRLRLHEAKEDSAKVDVMRDLASNLEHVDSCDAAFALIGPEYELASKLNYTYGVIMANWQYARYFIDCKKDYQAGTVYMKKAVALIDQHNLDLDPRVEMLVYFEILNHFFLLGDFTYAMELVTKRLKLYEDIHDKPMVAHYNSLIGFIFLREGRTADAKRYYNLYLEQSRELNDSCFIADAYNSMSDVYVSAKNYDSALANSLSAMTIYGRVSSRNYLRLPKTMSKQERIPYTAFKLGNVYKLSRNYANALKYTLDAISMNRNWHSNDPYDIAAFYINAGDIYRESKEYPKALRYIDTGLAISREIGHAENIRDAYRYRAQVYSALGRYDSAYTYDLLYEGLKDSINNEKTSREIQQVNAAYEVDKKNGEIVRLNQERELREATIVRQRQTQFIIIGSSVLVALIAGLLYNRRQLRQKNKFQTELNRQRNELFNTVLDVQERERKRIAQDLHDSLGSILSAAKLKLSELEPAGTGKPDQDDKYTDAMALLDEAASELRNISHNIMPATLAKVGLVAALKSLFDSISSYSALKIVFSAYGFDSRINEETEVSIYRIVLELVNNVVKHAQAREVVVQVIRHPESIAINVEDNGLGFDVAAALKNAGGIGLNNIVTRVEYLDGTVDFDSVKGKGTMVLINIPYL